MDANILTNEEVEALIVSIYLGRVDSHNLPLNLYSKTWDYLTKGLVEGFGDVETAEEQALIESLFQNVQAFSGAKTFQQVADFESYLLNADGSPVEYSQFRKNVLAKYSTYNKTYLETEYLYTVENAKAAKRWVSIWNDRVLFPLLEYVTVGDDRVRLEHKILDGTVRKVGDAFWSTYYPPIGYRCRCTTKSYEEGDKEITQIMNKVSVVPPKIDRQFRFNSGKKKIIFSPFHPYFTEIPKEMDSFAKYNFGLPIYKKIDG